MKLDLRFHSNLDPRWVSLYNRIANEIGNSFSHLIDSVSKQHAESIDWWVSSPASRNTLVSPLFHYCCCIVLLKELIQKKERISEIITDSKAFKEILEDYMVRQNLRVKITLAQLSTRQLLKKILWPIYSLFSVPLRHLLLFIVAKAIRSVRRRPVHEPLTLIDTFVLPGYIDEDRYYPKITDTLSEDEKRNVYFVPLLYGFRPWQYFSVIKRFRRSQRNFILKEDYLKLRDYLFSFGYVFRIGALRLNPHLFYGIDISPLVREEIRGFHELNSSFIALLNYSFARRLKQAGIQIRLVIDWFENQSIDRGWNAGFRRFFPKILIKGYQGYIVSSHYLCIYPTEEEKQNRVIPNRISVIGKGLMQPIRRFCSDLEVSVAPAFRYQHLWEERNSPENTDAFIILIALPIILTEAAHVLQLLANSENECEKTIRFWIKPHPATNPSKIIRAFGLEWPERFEFVNADFEECLGKANLLVSSMSSTCLETMARGIPVIVVGNRCGLTHNPIPETVTEDIWRFCFDHKEVVDAIKIYRNRRAENKREYTTIGLKIRTDFFEPVTRAGVRKFLELSC
jgi:hypothetical protein